MKYKYIGMLFEKKEVGDYNILNPVNVVRCNIINDITYDTEFLGEVASVFESIDDIDNTSIGFVVSEDKLIERYGTIEQALKYYKSELLDNIFLQIFDDNKVKTYKIDLFNNRMSEVIEFDDNELNPEDVKLKYKNEFEFYNQKDCENNKNEDIKESKTIIEKKNIESNNNIEKKNNEIKINIKELYKSLKESIIGQDETIKKVISTLDKNYNITNYRNKTNILLIGPAGSGKTEIFRTISEVINIPITIEDSEQYSAVGYDGANISEMLIKLYNNAGKDLELAQKGILVIDEIDKKISSSKDDVSGNRILNSLLSLMEGTNFRLNIGTEYDPNYINFNTNNLTVVLAGACSDIIEETKSIGFGNDIEAKQEKYSDITIKKLNKYGFSRELLRRAAIYISNELGVEEFVKIMKESKNSCLTEYYNYSKLKNVKLSISDEAIAIIAKIAHDKKIGVSGIKYTLDDLLNDAFFEIGINENEYSEIQITEETINQIPPYVLIKRSEK